MTTLGLTWTHSTRFAVFVEALVGKRWAYGATREEAIAAAALAYLGGDRRWGRA